MTVVLVRGYSLISGRISLLTEIATSGKRVPHRRGNRPLMFRIGIAVQQADRDAGDVLRTQHGDHRIQARRIQRNSHRSVRAHLFDHFQTQTTFHQCARLGPADVVQHRHAQVADLQDVAKTPSGDQRCLRTLRLQHSVRCHRGRVQNVADLARPIREQRTQPCNDALAVVVRGGCGLVCRDDPVARNRDQIGERATDIDADTQRHAAGSQATAGNGFRSLRRRVRRASVAATSMTGGSPATTTP